MDWLRTRPAHGHHTNRGIGRWSRTDDWGVLPARRLFMLSQVSGRLQGWTLETFIPLVGGKTKECAHLQNFDRRSLPEPDVGATLSE